MLAAPKRLGAHSPQRILAVTSAERLRSPNYPNGRSSLCAFSEIACEMPQPLRTAWPG